MQAALLQPKKWNRSGLLYPLLVLAALSVIIFSAIGAAALAGWLPRTDSLQRQGAAQQNERAFGAEGTDQAARSEREGQGERLHQSEPSTRARRIAATIG